MKTSAACCVVLLCLSGAPLAAAGFSIEDIEFWVGNGTNRSAVVFDWDGESGADASLAWGYRWDGAATAEDMLREVVSADPRLFAKFGRIASPNPDLDGVPVVNGLGYDANDDTAFAIDDGTAFGSGGTIDVEGVDDLAASVDPADSYREGWFLGYWHFGTSASEPFDGGGWATSFVGMHNRHLTDGSWDSWAFSTDVFASNVFAANPLAAPSEATADLDADGDTDLADLMALQRDFSAEGLQVWLTAFGQQPAASVTAVPEPATAAHIVFFLISFSCFNRGNR